MSRDQDFTLTEERRDQVAVIAPAGEVDLVTVHEVRDALTRAASSCRRVVLDLRQVTFMDSSGLRLLVEAQQEAERDGFAFAVVRGPASLERLFEVTGLDGRLDLFDDPAAAVDGAPGS
jgi:anti-anti-sigma factor